MCCGLVLLIGTLVLVKLLAPLFSLHPGHVLIILSLVYLLLPLSSIVATSDLFLPHYSLTNSNSLPRFSYITTTF